MNSTVSPPLQFPVWGILHHVVVVVDGAGVDGLSDGFRKRTARVLVADIRPHVEGVALKPFVKIFKSRFAVVPLAPQSDAALLLVVNAD